MGFFNSLKVAQSVAPFDSSDQQQNPESSGFFKAIANAAQSGAVKTVPVEAVFQAVQKVVEPVATAQEAATAAPTTTSNSYTVTPQQLSLGDTVYRSLPTGMLSRLSLASLKDILKKYEEEGEEVKGYAKGGAVYSMITESARRGEDLPDDQLEALFANLSPEEQDALLARLEEPQGYAFGGLFKRISGRIRSIIKRIRDAESPQTSTAAATPADSTATTETNSAPPLPQTAQTAAANTATPYAVNPVQYTLGPTQFRGLPQNMLSKLNARTLFDILGNYQDYPVKFADGGPVAGVMSVNNPSLTPGGLISTSIFQRLARENPDLAASLGIQTAQETPAPVPTNPFFTGLSGSPVMGPVIQQLAQQNPELATSLGIAQAPAAPAPQQNELLKAFSTSPILGKILPQLAQTNPELARQLGLTTPAANTAGTAGTAGTSVQLTPEDEEAAKGTSEITPLPSPSNDYTNIGQDVRIGETKFMPANDLLNFLRSKQMV